MVTGRLYKATINDLRDAAINAKSVLANDFRLKHVVYAIEDGGWIYASEYTPHVFMTDEEFEEYVKDAQESGVGMIYAIHKI